MMQLAKCFGFEPAHMQDWHLLALLAGQAERSNLKLAFR